MDDELAQGGLPMNNTQDDTVDDQLSSASFDSHKTTTPRQETHEQVVC